MNKNSFDFKKLETGTNIIVDGIIDRELYKNDNNGYKVQLIYIDKVYEETADGNLTQICTTNFTTTITGYFEATEGSNYRIRGEIGDYKGSNQIIVSQIAFLPPADEKGILDFLSSPLISGVGPKLAKKIVYGWNEKCKKTNTETFIKGFGRDTLNIIRLHHERLTNIPGITTRKANSIHKSYMKHIAYQEIVTFFLPYGVSTKQILKIYDEFKDKSIEVAKKNPYEFIKIEGFGFKTCDTIALKLGLDPKSKERINACLSYALQEASSSDGHCFLPKQELIDLTHELLKITISPNSASNILRKNNDNTAVIEIGSLSYKIDLRDLYSLPKGSKLVLDEVDILDITKCMDNLISKGELLLNHLTKEEILPMCKNPSIFDDIKDEDNIPIVSLPVIYYTESKVAQKLAFAATCWDFGDDVDNDVFFYIKEFEELQGYELEYKQKLAVLESVKSSCSIITGPAGSGKTTTILCLLYVLRRIHEKHRNISLNPDANKNKLIPSLCAPTGKAAKRMEQTSNKNAKTIHRLLESNGFDFTYDEHNILDLYSVIIVDEVSMIDIFLIKALICAINPLNTKIIILGDPNQLDSVGAGNVLDDLIKAKVISHTELDVVKRQALDSTILLNATNIINGDMIHGNKDRGDFYIINTDRVDDIVAKIIESTYRFINKYNYTIDDIQILSPQKRGPLGTTELNKRLQTLVNPPSPNNKEISITVDGETIFYRVNDKVMHIANSYNMIRYNFTNQVYEPVLNPKKEPVCGIFNGETGVITDILELALEDDEVETYVVVRYEDFYILYTQEALRLVTHSYALTVHKSQGSQFPIVIMPIHYSHKRMLNKKIGYTAVTRAQEKVVLIGQPYAVKSMVETQYTTRRYTLLKKLLIEEGEKLQETSTITPQLL